MRQPLRILFALLALTACVDPSLNAGISIGPNGASISPSISAGLDGGGTLTYQP